MTNVLRPTIAPAALATAIVALLAAGCGGSSGSASSSPKSRMIAQADAICKPLNARRKAADKQVGPVKSAAALPKIAALAPGIVAYERSAVAELRGLTPPSDLASAWAKILTGTELLVDNTAKLGNDAQAKDFKAVEGVIKEDQKSEQEVIAVAANAGFKHCGRNA